jgi:acyl carrier protein
MPIIDRILDVVADRCDIPPHQLGPATEFDSLGFDSLVLAELAVIIGVEYDLPITEEELADAGTVGEAALVCTSKLVSA